MKADTWSAVSWLNPTVCSWQGQGSLSIQAWKVNKQCLVCKCVQHPISNLKAGRESSTLCKALTQRKRTPVRHIFLWQGFHPSQNWGWSGGGEHSTELLTRMVAQVGILFIEASCQTYQVNLVILFCRIWHLILFQQLLPNFKSMSVLSDPPWFTFLVHKTN